VTDSVNGVGLAAILGGTVLWFGAATWRHPGYNPVSLLDSRERPQLPPSATRCLEVPKAALLLDAARTYPAKKHEPEMALAYPLIAAFLLTGGRAKEVLGLRLQDVSTDRQTVTFRPNEFHNGARLKTRGSTRTVPLWCSSRPR
jgi:integrase